MAAHRVAGVADIAEGTGKTFTVEGQPVAVFNIEGKFHAIDDTCKHRGGSLGGGALEGEVVSCPLHGWHYNVTTGECKTNPQANLKRFVVKVEGDDLILEV